jgi:hypothetical protein
MHIMKRIINPRQLLAMRDKLIHLEFARHVIVDEIGQLRAAFDAAEGAALPYATGDELESCWKGGQYEGIYFVCGKREGLRRVEISCPAAATPMMILSPQPLWQASSAERMTCTLPVQSKV